VALAYLSLGSNLSSGENDRLANLKRAIELLRRAGNATKVSSFYETEPVELTDQPWFINCAVELETALSPRELLDSALAIEREMGRDRATAPPKGPRLIDIDILLYDARAINEPNLRIPHPAMQQRRFVLEPLAEICPRTDVAAMLMACPDTSIVRRLK